MSNFIKGFFEKEWSVEEKVLCIILAALAGVIVGFFTSPVKSGLQVASGNGCYNSEIKYARPSKKEDGEEGREE